MAREKKENKSSGVINYEIPPKGSLGLLAAGDRGLRAWRKKRDQEKSKGK